MPKFDDSTIQTIFGHEAAEDENPDRLKEYYFKNKVYERITESLPLRILVGHKGIGKSALFKIAQLEDKPKGYLPIFIRPDDVLNVTKSNQDINTMVRAWKESLNEIIATKVFTTMGVGSQQKVANAGGAFLLNWIVEAVKQWFSKHTPLENSYKAIADSFINRQRINVYIDDLDRGWEGKREDVKKISALMNALRDFANENKDIGSPNHERGIFFRVALRADVYFLFRTSDESTDKIESAVVWQTWTNHEILALLVKRILTWGKHNRKDESELLQMTQPDLAKYLVGIMEERYKGRGKWSDIPTYRVLMTLIRRRPRDLVKLCSLAAQNAHRNDRDRIISADFTDSFNNYSQGRLQDTINEYRSELPSIERLLLNMKPSQAEEKRRYNTSTKNATSGMNTGKHIGRHVYSTDQIIKKLKDIVGSTNLKFADGKDGDPKTLLRFLYKINFLTARKDDPDSGMIKRLFFEENQYVSSQDVDFGNSWEIHPAYWWALEPTNITKILDDLDVSSDG